MGMGGHPVEIRLDLGHHCVETEIKRQYNRCLSAFFQSKGEAGAIEASIDLLQHALENFDFQMLRSRYPELAGHLDAEVILAIDVEGDIILILNKKAIYP
jgi:hypothetical protein